MPDFSDLEGLPIILKVWGGVWLFVSASSFLLIQRVLTIDDVLNRKAESSAQANLWRVNQYLMPKIGLARASDYINSTNDIRELQSIIQECAAPLNRLTRCHKCSDLSKIFVGLHAAALFLWMWLVLFTNIDEKATAYALFFVPLGIGAACGAFGAFLKARI